MAEPGLTEVVTTTLRNRTKIRKDNVSNNNAAFAKMKEKGCFKSLSGGRTIVEEVDYAENDTAKWIDPTEILDTSYNTTITAFEFNWRQLVISIVMSGYEQRINAGAEGIISLAKARVETAEKTLQNKANAAFFGDGTGSGGKEMHGLSFICSKTPSSSGTYGGVDRNSTGGAFARNYALPVISTFGTAASAANFKQIITKAKINLTRGNDVPDLCLAGNSYVEYAHGAAQATQVLYDENLAKLGFDNVVVNGIPVVLAGGVNFGGETLIGDTEMYLLNTQYVKLGYHKDLFFDAMEERWSINQDVSVKYIGLMGQIYSSAPRLQGRVFDS